MARRRARSSGTRGGGPPRGVPPFVLGMLFGAVIVLAVLSGRHSRSAPPAPPAASRASHAAPPATAR
ncbi:MAG TPA: hypothetical protein VGX97_02275, partial [bacterium]|nr:hypothetical protein [bacterium]